MNNEDEMRDDDENETPTDDDEEQLTEAEEEERIQGERVRGIQMWCRKCGNAQMIYVPLHDRSDPVGATTRCKKCKQDRDFVSKDY